MKSPTDDESLHGNESPSVREQVERKLESVGSGNIVELVRNVVGPEPLSEQPLSIRLFAILFLGFPLAMFFWAEWQFRRLIPFWISVPLTAIGFLSYLWKRLRKHE